MNENMEVVSTEVATPEETAESTVPETAETQPEGSSVEPTADAIPQDTADGNEPAQPSEEAEQPPITISVRFNHEDRELTREQAIDYAEQGMAYEKLRPTIDKIRMLAAGCNKSMDEMVDMLVNANDQMLRSRFLEETGGNERAADILLEDAIKKRQSAFDAQKQEEVKAEEASRQQVNDRLAAEFIELQKEFPDYGKFSDLPKAVVQMAFDKKITLYDALLRYERAEQKKVEQNRQQQAAASAATTGSRASASDDGVDPLIAAMMAGVNAAL